MVNPTTTTLTRLAALGSAATAAHFNTWPPTQFLVGGSQAHIGMPGIDNDPSTYALEPSVPARFSLLRSDPLTLRGLYIKTGGADGTNVLTDYHVRALHRGIDDNDFSTPVVGQVCGATSALTAVTFTNPGSGDPWIHAHDIFIHATNTTSGGSVAINEIWPIWVDDKVHVPRGNGRKRCIKPEL